MCYTFSIGVCNVIVHSRWTNMLPIDVTHKSNEVQDEYVHNMTNSH